MEENKDVYYEIKVVAELSDMGFYGLSEDTDPPFCTLFPKIIMDELGLKLGDRFEWYPQETDSALPEDCLYRGTLTYGIRSCKFNNQIIISYCEDDKGDYKKPYNCDLFAENGTCLNNENICSLYKRTGIYTNIEPKIRLGEGLRPKDLLMSMKIDEDHQKMFDPLIREMERMLTKESEELMSLKSSSKFDN